MKDFHFKILIDTWTKVCFKHVLTPERDLQQCDHQTFSEKKSSTSYYEYLFVIKSYTYSGGRKICTKSNEKSQVGTQNYCMKHFPLSPTNFHTKGKRI